MDRIRLLIILAAVCSFFAWWPVIMEPNLDLPFWWFPLVLVSITTALCTMLSEGRFRGLVAASFLSTIAGVSSGFLLWKPLDKIDASFVPLVMLSAVLASLAVSLVTALSLSPLKLSNQLRRRYSWFALIVCIGCSPVIALLTPSLVIIRVAHNDQLAYKRMIALNIAAIKAAAENSGSGTVCSGIAIKAYYSGPRFRDKDWQYIVGNYITHDGYSFSMFCDEHGGYVIDARPNRQIGDGTRTFCTDESHHLGCAMAWNGLHRTCTPCSPQQS